MDRPATQPPSHARRGHVQSSARIDGGRLTALRLERGLANTEDLGRLAGISGSMVSRFEQGEGRPTTATVHRLARVLRVDADQLLGSRR
jgi:transcriptional regulator with XRE-family HTH domain